LQGAQGDINSCRICSEEEDALRVLDVIGARYARVIENGLAQAKPLSPDRLVSVSNKVAFSTKPWSREKLIELLGEQEAILHAPDASDEQQEVRMAVVYAGALRSMIKRLDRGESLTPTDEIHGLRLGPVAFMGTPFEVFRSIKNDAIASAKSPLPLVMGFTNDSSGYAIDHNAAAKGGYEADMVPFICRRLPFANMHEELVEALKALDQSLDQATITPLAK